MNILEIAIEEAKRHGYTLADLKGRSRRPHIYKVRQYAMYRAYTETDKSLTVVGQVFNRDHTTVLHSVRKVEKDVEKYKNLGPRPAYRIRPKRKPAETYDGHPCIHGHGTLRYASSFKCVVCAKASEMKQNMKHMLLAAE